MGICIYLYICGSCLFFENNYIYIQLWMQILSKNCTGKSFAEISLYLSHQASLKKDSHNPAHLKNMSMVESQRAPHAYRHASWRALCEGPGRAVCVAGGQNHIISTRAPPCFEFMCLYLYIYTPYIRYIHMFLMYIR